MPAIVTVETVFPQYQYSQEETIKSLIKLWQDKITNTKRIQSIQENVLVKNRHLSMPIEDYFKGLSFGERNSRFIQTALSLIEKGSQIVLEKYNLEPHDINSLWSNTVTGFAIPSLEARLMNKIPFKRETKRYPLMGLGCMAGVAGLNRVSDYLKAYPKEAALFMSVECCSLTFQLNDFSVANIVSTGLFGDGGAVVLMVGDEHPLYQTAPLKSLAYESVFFPETEDVMGWDVGEMGLKIILNKNVPDVTRNQLAGPLKEFLFKQKVELNEITSFLAHPGGPKVLESMEEILSLPPGGLVHSWESLKENGNMSSVSVLDIIQRHLIEYEKNKQDFSQKLALSLAMGPAFSAELGLFRWN